MSLLEVSGVSASYGRVQALWDVGLTVDSRMIVALVGANAAGKTTLLRVLSGMMRPSAGSIHFDGREISSSAIETIADLGIAHVPEGRRLFSGLTVRDNILLGGWRRRNRDMDRVLEMFPALRPRLSQVAGTMSGGEQQMCAIARSLMGRPALLMIDELSLGLAPKIVDEIVASLPAVAAGGTAVLLVDQDIDTALTVSEQAYVLENGRITVSGSSESLLADPRVQEAYLGLAG